LWILGSSLFGAQLAAELGLPYAFAAHFAPAALEQALAIYRERFKPSAQLQRPYAMVCINVVVADTGAAAQRLFTSIQQSFTNLIRGTRGQLPPPIDDMEAYWSPLEKAHASSMLTYALVGSPGTVSEGLKAVKAGTAADELMFVSGLYDHAARLRSFELLAQIRERLPL
jgi:luciferase family oxidoreductase group 1